MSQAAEDFRRQLAHVDQLVAIHGKLQRGRGRRHETDALHRAGVVLTVAAWQAYVEKIIEEALRAIDADMANPAAPAPHWAVHTFQLRRAEIQKTIKKFNTPNDVNVRDIFQDSFSFAPWTSWEWRVGPRQWDSAETRRRTNTWVLVRHSIAHGFSLPPDVAWLQGENGQARLTLSLMKECRKHFAYLVDRTDRAFASHLANIHGIAPPW
jgi:hypothetical protein